MFKLVIADDEIRIREGFMRIVNWADMRFQVTGCYSDGSYVLEHLRREHVDVVLTDIKMKNISGLDLAQKIKEEYPNTYCVLVSAYQEFDFAHQAIALGVKDYLFKPTRLNDIRRVFVKLAQDLEHESELLEQQDVNRCKYEEMSQLWRSQFLYDLYMGAIRNEELIKKQEEHYYPEIKRCAVITVDYSVDLSAQQQEEVQGILYRLFQGTLEHTTFDAVSFEDNTLSVIAVADADTLKEDEEALSIRLADLVMQADEAAGIKLCKVSVHTYKTLYAFSCRPRRMFHSAAGQESPELDGSSQAHFRLQQRALLSYISADDEEKAQALAGEMVLQLGNLSPAMAQMLVVDTAASIQIRLNELADRGYSLPNYDRLLLASDRMAVSQWLIAQIHEWMLLLPRKSKPQQVIHLLKAYIQDHYSQSISLDMAANAVFLSPVYVSRLFKQETGSTFIEYLTQFRIEKAKGMLADSSMKVADVGVKTGYENPRYFYRVFKASTGITPSEFRQSLFQEEKA